MLFQMKLLGQLNKTGFIFIRERSKILLVKQQLKWCKILQIPPDSIERKKKYMKTFIFQMWKQN